MKSVIYGMTTFEVWHGRKPMVHHLRMFGCIVYVRNTTPHLKKLEDRGCKMIFIGYESGSKAYHAYDLITKHVHVTRDVVFDEQAQWDWGSVVMKASWTVAMMSSQWSTPPWDQRLQRWME
jgi:hypothetical protein